MIGEALWSLDRLLADYPEFKKIERLQPDHPVELVSHRAEQEGIPLVIENYHRDRAWKGDILSVKWIENYWSDNPNPPELYIRNVDSFVDKQTSMSDYLSRCRQWNSPSPRPDDIHERWYAKDMTCPSHWIAWLKSGDLLPQELLFFDRCDLLQYLPESLRPETLMCYLGTHDTYTPAHKDLCGSVGHNLMVDTESQGSAFWFMTKTADAHKAAQYLQKLGYELDHENHALTLEQLSKAPFDVYVTEQRKGDLVLVPPSSMHQVVNQGGITLKVSWSRMTPRSLYIAVRQELDIYRRVCRKEVYRCKLTAFAAIKQITEMINPKGKSSDIPDKPRFERQKLLRDLDECFKVYENILITEWSSQSYPLPKDPDIIDNPLEAESNEPDSLLEKYCRTCDFCEGDIFNAFFNCHDPECSSTKRSGHVDLCPGCFVEGRSCNCGVMTIHQIQSFEELLKLRDKAKDILKGHLPEYADTRQDESEKWLKSKAQVCMFEAACIFHRETCRSLAKNGKNAVSRACRAANISPMKESHQVPIGWWLRCVKCHCGYCFPHLLERARRHSAEFLLDLDRVHDLHRNPGNPDGNDQPNLEDAKVYLAQIAKHYAYSMRNVDLSSKVMKSGFYDNFGSQANVKLGPMQTPLVDKPKSRRKNPDNLSSEAMGDSSTAEESDGSEFNDGSMSRKSNYSCYVTKHPREASKNLKRLVQRLDEDEDGNIRKRRRNTVNIVPKQEDEDEDVEDIYKPKENISISETKFTKRFSQPSSASFSGPKTKTNIGRRAAVAVKGSRSQQGVRVETVVGNVRSSPNQQCTVDSIPRKLPSFKPISNSRSIQPLASTTNNQVNELAAENLVLKNRVTKLEVDLKEEKASRKKLEDRLTRLEEMHAAWEREELPVPIKHSPERSYVPVPSGSHRGRPRGNYRTNDQHRQGQFPPGHFSNYHNHHNPDHYSSHHSYHHHPSPAHYTYPSLPNPHYHPNHYSPRRSL